MAEVKRTREFLPGDHEHFRPDVDINGRIDQLKEKRDSFDPETQFVGLKRLGSSYTVAEPFAYLDGPTKEQKKFTKLIYQSGMAVAGLLGMIIGHKIKMGTYATGVSRGLLMGIPLAYIGGKFHDFSVDRGNERMKVLFHYALLHENDFPVVERKKFGQIIKDYPCNRSLNVFGNSIEKEKLAKLASPKTDHHI